MVQHTVFLLLIASIANLITLTSGQTFQYSRGWTNGKRSSRDLDVNLLSSSNEHSSVPLIDDSVFIMEKQNHQKREPNLAIGRHLFLNTFTTAKRNSVKVSDEHIFKLFEELQNVIKERNAFLRGLPSPSLEENDY